MGVDSAVLNRERTSGRPVYLWRLADKTIELGNQTRIAGVVNITPDSFYDGGRFLEREAAVQQGLKLVEAGADLLDIGAESSRPGADPVEIDEELARLLPVVRQLRRQTAVPLMVDTYKAAVAREALQAGADAVNDISAFRFEPAMASLVAEFGAGLVLMHMRGRPKTMQRIPPATDIWKEILADLSEAARKAEAHGIGRDRIALDPGIGFGKTVEDNLLILNRLSLLGKLQLPIFVGTSRKSFIGKLLDLPAEERLFATIASVTVAIVQGAHIVRVHDVEEMRQAVDLTDAIVREGGLG